MLRSFVWMPAATRALLALLLTQCSPASLPFASAGLVAELHAVGGEATLDVELSLDGFIVDPNASAILSPFWVALEGSGGALIEDFELEILDPFGDPFPSELLEAHKRQPDGSYSPPESFTRAYEPSRSWDVPEFCGPTPPCTLAFSLSLRVKGEQAGPLRLVLFMSVQNQSYDFEIAEDLLSLTQVTP